MNFFMKMMLKKQMKGAGVPEAEAEKFLEIIEKNPDFFKEVAEEAKKKVDAGMGQQEAVQAVLMERQEQLKKVMGA